MVTENAGNPHNADTRVSGALLYERCLICFSQHYKHSANTTESFNRLPATETAAPGNGVKRISMAEGLLSSLTDILARQPMSGQPAGDTEHAEAVTCPG